MKKRWLYKLSTPILYRASLNQNKMGNGTSLPKVEGFSAEEVSRLEKRFQKLDLDHSGSISVGEFLSVPELKENPLVKRVVDVFDSDLSGEVDFKGKSQYCFVAHHYHLVISLIYFTPGIWYFGKKDYIFHIM